MTNTFTSYVQGIDYDGDPGTSSVNPLVRSGLALKIAGHLVGAGSTNTVAMQAGAGTSPPAAVITNTNDGNGTITFGTGTTPAAGDLLRITFTSSWASAPKAFSLTPMNSATAALGPFYISAVSTTTFTIACSVAPAASQANTIYSLSYIVIG